MMREFPVRKWKNVIDIILLEKLTKPAQLTELQIAVAVALRERMKTLRSLRNSFAAKKANRFGLKEDTLNIIWTKTFFRLRQTLLQAVVIYARRTLHFCYYYVILRVCLFAFAFVAFE